MDAFLEWLREAAALLGFIITLLALMALGPVIMFTGITIALYILRFLEWLESY